MKHLEVFVLCVVCMCIWFWDVSLSPSGCAGLWFILGFVSLFCVGLCFCVRCLVFYVCYSFCVFVFWCLVMSSPVGTDKHGCRSQHVSNSNSASVKYLLLLPSPTASSQPTLPRSIHHPSSIIHHQWQLPISSLLNPPCLNFPDIQ